MELATTDPDDTRRLAGAVAHVLRPGDVVALTGELGAGKTCFVQGVARALGVTDRVTSPSFLLRRDYEGTVPIVHLDVYRLETLHEALDLDWGEEAERALVLIEWGDAVRAVLPDEHLEVELRLAEPATAPPAREADDALAAAEPRRVRLIARGPGWQRRLEHLAAAVAPWRSGDPAPADAVPPRAPHEGVQRC